MQQGYTYHIKDEFFQQFDLPYLMSNRENGGYRPHFCAIRDQRKENVYWMIPITSKVEKFHQIYGRKVARHGRCDTIVFGNFAGDERAFLLQNMFPVTEQYIDHVHTVRGVPVIIHQRLERMLQNKVRTLLSMYRNGRRLIFVDIYAIYNHL